MKENYTEIYNQRGGSYHKAMQVWPHARRREFETLIDIANLREKQSSKNQILYIADIPSGGGYLLNYIDIPCLMSSIDPAGTFLHSGTHPGVDQVISAPHDSVPVEDCTYDVIFSLAGLHHISEQDAAYREWFRILKPEGILVIADGESDTPTTQFLDQVVDRFNSMGHSGKYLNAHSSEEIKAAGFDISFLEYKRYDWLFKDRDEMVAYCKVLFGLNLCSSDSMLLKGIYDTVGYEETTEECRMHWGLRFIKARKLRNRTGKGS